MVDKNIRLNTIMKKTYSADTKKWNDAYFYAETQKFMTKEESEKMLKRAKSNRALKDKDFANYEKMTLDLLQRLFGCEF